MIAVFDANVLTKMFLEEPYSAIAIDLGERASIYAPDIAEIEVVAAITRAYRNGRVPLDMVNDLIGRFHYFFTPERMEIIPFSELIDNARKLSLTMKHPLMDCLYLALAMREGIQLITADQPFIDAAKAHYPDIRHLSSTNH